MESSTQSGRDMPKGVFTKALDLTRSLEQSPLGVPVLVLLSGGECTDHPKFFEYVDQVISRGWQPVILTNGLWLEDAAFREKLLEYGVRVTIQVTHDPRYYPRRPARVTHPSLIYVDSLTVLTPLGRAARESFRAQGLRSRVAPSCFNLRSMTRRFGGIRLAIQQLRLRALMGKSGQCIPSITVEGSIVVGECRECYQIGTIHSSVEDLTQGVLNMPSCNRCTQEGSLAPEYRKVIGL